MPTASPFRIAPRHEATLAGNEVFVAVQTHLRRQEKGVNAPSFCTLHRHSCSSDEQASFQLHRNIIHTILLPLFLLHNQASRIASRTLLPRKAVELERAFRGEARSAYAWLHCVISEEYDWYMTARCPACIVLHVLHSEPTIRFVAVACMLSSDHREEMGFLGPMRQLPNFDFWLSALETAVREDPLWSDDCWPEIEYRASSLTDSVRELVLQCLEMRVSLDRARPALADQRTVRTTATTTTTGLSSSSSSSAAAAAVSSARHPMQTIALKPSSFARRQIKMTREEEKWVAGLATSYYLQLRWNERAQALSNRAGVHVHRPGLRRRSITS